VLRIDWDELDPSVRAVIQTKTGPVLAARTAAEGKNSHLAALLDTPSGTFFVKGLRKDHPGVVTQQREAAVNPFVRPLSPALLWQTENTAWHLLGFEYAPGRHADYSPGSPDLPKVFDAMARLAQLPCPDMAPLKRAERRWAAYVDDPADLTLLAGDTLLHTDYNPYNVLIHDGSALLIDWAWPTKGAAFIDPACLIVRLIFAGHTPAEAEATVTELPAWTTAPRCAIDVYAIAVSHMWAEIAEADPTPWKKEMRSAAKVWRTYRQQA
jgi:hypothetical protein